MPSEVEEQPKTEIFLLLWGCSQRTDQNRSSMLRIQHCRRKATHSESLENSSGVHHSYEAGSIFGLVQNNEKGPGNI